VATDSPQAAKAAFVNASDHTLRVEHVPLEDALGPISFALQCHRDRYRSFEVDPWDARNVLCFGAGPLAGAKLYGFHRLIFAARSPLWHGFFLSSMGGAALPLYHSGVDYVAIEGRSDDYTLVALTGAADGTVEAQFDSITARALAEIFQGYQGERGLYALQQYAYDRFNALYRAEGDSGEGKEKFMDFRILALGPAALQTNFGAIGSTVIRSGKFKLGNDDWAGRGGMGSLMAQAHRVVAIAYGGTYDGRTFVENLKDRKVVDALFQDLVHERYVDLVIKSGKKYRYDEAVKSSGTFGVNMSVLGEWLLSFNWASVKLSEEDRKRLYALVKEHYLKQFNEEIVEPRTFATCGEPCPLACKKLYHGHKKDYEPYEALGPNAGIFDQRAAERVVKEVEVLGFDTIEFGNVSSWMLECLANGLITKDELGLTADVAFDPRTFRIEDSDRNADAILKLAALVAYGRGIGAALAKGVRVAAEELNKQFAGRVKRVGETFVDTTLYLAYGETGCISPVQYWVPGALAPIPVQGKYLTNYCINTLPPRELGRSCADRAIKELYSEELGICRFHRCWTEKTVETLLRRGRRIDRSLDEHCRGLMRQIIEYDRSANQLPVFWETKRTRAVIRAYLAEVRRKLPAEAGELDRWVTEFARDEEEAARAYWEETLRGYEELIGD
jgi:glyceraldehyde-3-phosphate dehydrogenase (ferredoxin)